MSVNENLHGIAEEKGQAAEDLRFVAHKQNCSSDWSISLTREKILNKVMCGVERDK